MVGLVYDPVYLEHNMPGHPESPDRLKSCLAHLKSAGILERLQQVKAKPAGATILKLIHSEEHINHIRHLATQGEAWVDPDTYISPGSYLAAAYAVGGVLAASSGVVSGDMEAVFALVRPPGHHATRDRAMGFCLFNNVAIAAAYAIEYLKLRRVAVIDFDVHHGNGTEAAFYADPRVLYISLHQYPFYPGTGAAEDVGEGEGQGTNVNLPLPAGCGDEEYIRVWDQIVPPVVNRFHPQLLLISAGYDGHWADPIGAMCLTIKGFGQIARRICDLAHQNSSLGTVWALEGGYHLEALAGAVEATIRVLLGDSEFRDPLGSAPYTAPIPDIEPQIKQFKTIHHLL